MKSFFGRSKASSKSPLLRWQGKENFEGSPYPLVLNKPSHLSAAAPRLPFGSNGVHEEMLVAGYCDYNVQRCPIYTRNICDLHSDVLRSVKLPFGVDSNAWIAFKLVDIVSELTVLCNAIAEFCTESSCPMMRAGPFYEYAWADPILFPSPTMLSAPKYMELLLNWVDSELCKELDDESFIPQVKVFSRRLFRVYAHLFTEHIPDITTIMFHLRYSLYHFMIFAKEFDLGISESETNSIKSIVESFKL